MPQKHAYWVSELVIMLLLVGVWVGAIALVFVRWRKLRDLQQQPIVSFKKPLHLDKVRVVKSPEQAVIYLKPTAGTLDKSRSRTKKCKSASATPRAQSPTTRSQCDRSVFSFDDRILRNPNSATAHCSPAAEAANSSALPRLEFCNAEAHLQPQQQSPIASLSSRSSPSPNPAFTFSEATSGVGPSLSRSPISSVGYQLPIYQQESAREPTITISPVPSPDEEPGVGCSGPDADGSSNQTNTNTNSASAPTPLVVLVQMHAPKEDAFQLHETATAVLAPDVAGGSSAPSSDSAETYSYSNSSSREREPGTSQSQSRSQEEQQQQQEDDSAVFLERNDRVHYWQMARMRHIDSSFTSQSHTSQEK